MSPNSKPLSPKSKPLSSKSKPLSPKSKPVSQIQTPVPQIQTSVPQLQTLAPSDPNSKFSQTSSWVCIKQFKHEQLYTQILFLYIHFDFYI